MNRQSNSRSNLRWSDGSTYQQSKRPARSSSSNQNNFNEEEFFQAEQLTPLARSLANDESWHIDGDGNYFATIPYSITTDTDPQLTPANLSEFKNSSNKKEETYTKMAERQLVGKGTMNPYLAGGASYADDVASDFLKPVSMSQDKIATTL